MSNKDPAAVQLENARCLWATIRLYTTEPPEYRKRWDGLPLDIREKVLKEWRAKKNDRKHD